MPRKSTKISGTKAVRSTADFPSYIVIIAASFVVVTAAVYVHQLFSSQNFSTSDPGYIKFCSASDLAIDSRFLGTPTEVNINTVRFTNKTNKPCALQGFPDIQIGTSSQKFQVYQYHLPADAKVEIVQPNKSAFAQFVWGNWCGAKGNPISVYVTIPGTLEQIQTEVADASGKNIAETPTCSSSSGKSSLAVGPFIGEAELGGS